MRIAVFRLLTLIMLACLFGHLNAQQLQVEGLPDPSPKDEFAGGSGAQNDPWLIATAEHLHNIRNYVGTVHADKHFLQIADINLGVAPWNEGVGWLPVGTASNRFQGKYNGDGHLISGLTINRPQTGSIALFGFVGSEGVLANIHLVNAEVVGASQVMGTLAGTNSGTVSNASATGSISGGYRVGGLVGENNPGTVEYAFADVVVSAVSGRIGGLVGFNVGGTVYQSHAIADVNGGWYVGGVVGRSIDGHIALCYATGNISGSNAVGGLVGDAEGGMVINSYAAGNATGTMAVGGLIGYLWQTNVQNTYAIGSVGGGNFDHGGLIGYNFGGSITNSYWNTETAGQAGSAGGTGKTTAELLDEDTFTGWDFQSTWSMAQGDSYPWLQWQQTGNGHNFPYKHVILLEALPEYAGTASANPDLYYFEAGELISLTAAPNDGYVFINWHDATGAIVSDQAVFDFIMPDHDAHLIANFDTNAFTVSFVVVDEDDNPIQDAVITLNDNAQAPGEYVFEGIAAGNYFYTVSKQGYFDHHDSLYLNNQDTSLVVMLIEDITFMASGLQDKILIFPNPATDRVYINDFNNNIKAIRLYKLNGKLLLTKTINEQGTHILSLTEYRPGIYLLQLDTMYGSFTRKLLLVEM